MKKEKMETFSTLGDMLVSRYADTFMKEMVKGIIPPDEEYWSDAEPFDEEATFVPSGNGSYFLK